MSKVITALHGRGQGHRLSDIAVRNLSHLGIVFRQGWVVRPQELQGLWHLYTKVRLNNTCQKNTPLRSQSLKAATEVIELVDSLSSLTMALILKLRLRLRMDDRRKKNISSHPPPWPSSPPLDLSPHQLRFRRNDLKKSLERLPGHFLTMFDLKLQVKPSMTLQKTWKHLIFAFIIFQTDRMLAAL